MAINIVPSLAEPVGNLWRALQADYRRDDFYVAAPLSSTPLPIYQWIIEHAERFSHWPKVKFVLMDEQVDGSRPPFTYVPVDDPASYEGFARRHLIDVLQEERSVQLAVMKPELSRLNSFEVELDLLILALGVNGNYANVMPDTPESAGWHIAHLIPEFRQAHTQPGSGSYEQASFREFGMSLGPQQVLAARNIAVIVSGAKKHGLARQLLSYREFNPDFPLSIIYHPAIAERVELFFTEDVGV